jgi:transposase
MNTDYGTKLYLLFNTTGLDLKTRYAGIKVEIPAREMKGIYDPIMAKFIAKKLQNDGVVLYDYNEEMRHTYATEDEYKREIQKKGLKRAIDKYTALVKNEEVFESDAKVMRKFSELTHSKKDYFEPILNALKTDSTKIGGTHKKKYYKTTYKPLPVEETKKKETKKVGKNATTNNEDKA